MFDKIVAKFRNDIVLTICVCSVLIVLRLMAFEDNNLLLFFEGFYGFIFVLVGIKTIYPPDDLD